MTHTYNWAKEYVAWCYEEYGGKGRTVRKEVIDLWALAIAIIADYEAKQ